MIDDTELPIHPLQNLMLRLNNRKWFMDELEEKKVYLFTKRGREILIDFRDSSLMYDRSTLQ